ncbi:hypothetical protein ABT112_16710 [Streptomyces sp. NPDC002055]|uniref:hypothetical protein n=1 Tax=Streptomyces sp. NPDC002055 TaxID=3154534 RepID=UPI00333358A2
MHALHELRAEYTPQDGAQDGARDSAQDGAGDGSGAATGDGTADGSGGTRHGGSGGSGGSPRDAGSGILARHRAKRRKRRRAAEGGSGLGAVKMWHMVRNSGTTALCGRELDPRAAIRPEDSWGTTREPCCHTCGATYLREVP